MIEGTLVAKNGKRYKLYISPSVKKEHEDFEVMWDFDKGTFVNIVWEAIEED